MTSDGPPQFGPPMWVLDLILVLSASMIGLLVYHAAGLSELAGLLLGFGVGVYVVGRDREAMAGEVR
jgi:hypothetical protein